MSISLLCVPAQLCARVPAVERCGHAVMTPATGIAFPRVPARYGCA